MEWLKKRLTDIKTYIVLFVLSILIPVIINELYKYGQVAPSPYQTLWDANDALSFFGDYLSFFGTIVLGAVAVFQTDKAHRETKKSNALASDALTQAKRANDLAAEMQKLEQANFVSIVSVPMLDLDKQSVAHPNYLNRRMPDREKIDMTSEGFSCSYCFHIDVMFENNSDFPIVEINSHAGMRSDNTYASYGIKDTTSSIYIPPHGTQAIRFIIPSTEFDNVLNYSFYLSIDFVNVYDYTTRASISFPDLEKHNGRTEYSYRLEKFTDVRPG